MAVDDAPSREPQSYIYCGCRPWHRDAFERVRAEVGGTWTFVSERDELTTELVRALRPRYLFFVHWSWIVPPEVVGEFECVNFHMTALPFGRGGSPLQHLVLLGRDRTTLTAHRMTDQVDAGPVYTRRELVLDGTAEAVYVRATEVARELIAEIAATEPEPQPQQGDVVAFARRKPSESELPREADLDRVYDFVRMLDADGYPRAFFERGGLRFELRRAARYDGRVEADVVITPVGTAS